MTTLSIPIPPETEAKLRERAAAFGKDIVQYAAGLIEQGIRTPTIDEILEPVRQDFARSGMSNDQIMDLGRSELAALRAENRPKST